MEGEASDLTRIWWVEVLGGEAVSVFMHSKINFVSARILSVAVSFIFFGVWQGT